MAVLWLVRWTPGEDGRGFDDELSPKGTVNSAHIVYQGLPVVRL